MCADVYEADLYAFAASNLDSGHHVGIPTDKDNAFDESFEAERGKIHADTHIDAFLLYGIANISGRKLDGSMGRF